MPTNRTNPHPGANPSNSQPDRRAHLRKVAESCARSVQEFAADDRARQANSPTGRLSVIGPQDHGTWRGPGK
jgi:hypothetical protein